MDKIRPSISIDPPGPHDEDVSHLLKRSTYLVGLSAEVQKRVDAASKHLLEVVALCNAHCRPARRNTRE